MGELRVEGLGRDYGDFRLAPTALAFPAGSFTVLLGPSGSGKSTLLRLMAGIEEPDEGRVLLEGRDVTRLPAEARGIGLVFQDGALFPHLSVLDNVAFGLRVQRAPRPEREARARELLRLVDLEGKEDRRVARLSGGERQRVALARALAPRPRVLLLDEPLASLDRNLREDLRRHLRRLHETLGLTTVLVTHDRDEALALADRLVLMRDGAVVEQGAPRDVFRSPRTAFAARFLGSANVLADGTLVPLDKVRVEADPQGEGVVEEVRYAGFHDEARIRLDDGTTLDARLPGGSAPPRGARVRTRWDHAKGPSL